MKDGRHCRRVLSGAVLTTLVLVLTACGQDSSGQGAGTPTSGPASTQPSPAASASVPDELTAEQALANNPPPPQALQAAVTEAGVVELTWTDPPPVAVAHSYSDRVVAYRVYRRGSGEPELRPIGVTHESVFRDGTARVGQTYEYAVSSIRENDVEGSRTDGVRVSMP